MKRIVCLVLSIVSVLTIFLNCFSLAKSFEDVSQDHWAYNYIDTLSNEGVINGYGDGTFNPSGTITRAEFIKLLVCCLDNETLEKAKIAFGTQNYKEWYEYYYMIAARKKIIDYEYFKLNANEPISREEMTKQIYNFFLCYKKVDSISTEVQSGDIKNFLLDNGYINDSNMTYEDINNYLFEMPEDKRNEIFVQLLSIDPYSGYEFKHVKEYQDLNDTDNDLKYKIDQIIDKGIMNGYEDNTFKLDNNLSRAEAATVIYRIKNSMKG